MEYERHASRLVLGFLKNNCFTAYKAFLKNSFQNQGNHINTRIAGQNLEDILRTYSRITEIVQGHIEDTNYPIEQGSEKLSPIFLAEQLLYLLEHSQVKHFPRSRRTSTESSFTEQAESHAVDNDDIGGHVSDVETTPENSLPGNVKYYSSKRTSNERTVLSPKRKQARPEKVVVDKEALSEVMSEKLLQNTEFQQKLANTITTVLNTPEVHKTKYRDNVTAELDTTIKSVLQRTEQDPIFEEVLQEFLGGPSASKSRHNALNSTSSDRHLMDVETPNKYLSSHTDRGSESSDLNETCKEKHRKNLLNTINSHELSANHMPERSLSAPLPLNTHTSFSVPNSTSAPNSLNISNTTVVSQQQFTASTATNPLYINPATGGLFMVPQPYYVINQPISVASSCQPISVASNCQPFPVTSNCQTIPVDSNCQPILMQSVVSNQNPNLLTPTNQAGPAGVPNTQVEAKNIQEYLTMFDDTKQSPLVKVQEPQRRGLKKVMFPKKSAKTFALQPRQTVKVEILHVESISKQPEQVQPTQGQLAQVQPEQVKAAQVNPDKNDGNMPSVSCESEPMATSLAAIKSSNEIKIKNVSADKDVIQAPDLITPSPSITAVQKRTPKSGSHIRNLTFPSPTKESKMSRSSDAKLCVEKNTQEKSTDTVSASCWDAGLRIFVEPIIPDKKEEIHTSPKKRKTPKRITKATELKVTEMEGKLLEEALNTPKNNKKKCRNTPCSTKKVSKSEIKDPEHDKKILSPSKLQKANKINLSYEGSKETEIQAQQFLQEETPLKNFPPTPGLKTSETPFTPMLQANLKEITGGDIFCIDTPNFPVTPGLSFMTNSTNYYLFQDDDKALKQEMIKADDGKKSTNIPNNNSKTTSAASDNITANQTVVEEDVIKDAKSPLKRKKRKKSEETSEPKIKKPRLSPKKKQISSKTVAPPKKVTSSPPKKGLVRKGSQSPGKIKKKTKTPESSNSKKRHTRSSVVSKLKNSKPSNSPRNDSDDQCNFFKASGTNLKKLKSKQNKKQVSEKQSHKIVKDNLDENIVKTKDKEAELHMALLTAIRQDFTICHFNEESHSYTYSNETTPSERLSYDASILNKKRKVTVFSAQDEEDEIQIILSATKFSPLLDLGQPSFDVEGDSLQKEGQPSFSVDGDSLQKDAKENGLGEPLGVKNTKRRSRSDSTSSHASTSSKKREVPLTVNTSLLKDININSFLSRIHGDDA